MGIHVLIIFVMRLGLILITFWGTAIKAFIFKNYDYDNKGQSNFEKKSEGYQFFTPVLRVGTARCEN